MTWGSARWLAAWAIIAGLGAWSVLTVWFSCPGLVPLLAFAACWFARPMTWESEFDHAASTQLGKAR